MSYSKQFSVNSNHIDIQGIMDGLYYPFYMEECRHDFVRDMMNFDIDKKARQGINMILTSYFIKYLRPLREGDKFQVNCQLFKDAKKDFIFHLKQEIIMDGKVYSSATFTATCVNASGGRPFLPIQVKEKVLAAPMSKS